MRKYSIRSLLLNKFRNYNNLEISIEDAPVVLHGCNGVGKTNLLESLSLLFPGRGLRAVPSKEFGCCGSKDWSIYSVINNGVSDSSIGIGKLDGKNITKIDGKLQSSRCYLSDALKMLWLTPQMDSIFLHGAAHRRKFFDRIVYLFSEEHAVNIVNYEHYKYQRSKLLRESMQDSKWLSSIEKCIADYGVAIAKARVETIKMLESFINCKHTGFPEVKLSIEGAIERLVQEGDVDHVSVYRDMLCASRYKDTLTSKTNIGIHTSEFRVKKADGDVHAKSCSTGEQKLLLISIILSAVWAMIEKNNIRPILLLDDIISHLDNNYCQALLNNINDTGCHAWFSHTDDRVFKDHGMNYQYFNVHDFFTA